jgi:hypothetical protein
MLLPSRIRHFSLGPARPKYWSRSLCCCTLENGEFPKIAACYDQECNMSSLAVFNSKLFLTFSSLCRFEVSFERESLGENVDDTIRFATYHFLGSKLLQTSSHGRQYHFASSAYDSSFGSLPSADSQKVKLAMKHMQQFGVDDFLTSFGRKHCDIFLISNHRLGSMIQSAR